MLAPLNRNIRRTVREYRGAKSGISPRKPPQGERQGLPVTAMNRDTEWTFAREGIRRECVSRRNPVAGEQAATASILLT
jgi:hypothetical protein